MSKNYFHLESGKVQNLEEKNNKNKNNPSKMHMKSNKMMYFK